MKREILGILCRITKHRHRTPLRLGFKFENGERATGTHLEISMFINQSVVATLVPVTATGTPAAINGDAIFTTDHPELVDVSQLDALNAKLSGVPTGVIPAAGVAVVVTATFNAAFGSDPVHTITATATLQIEPSPAASATITFSAPTP